LFVDEGIPAPAGSPALTGLKLDPSVFFTWAAMPDATSYDVVRGRLSLLRSSGGDFTTTLITCWANDDAETEIEDADPPPPGDGFWYLARSVNCAGAGTYDSGAPSQAGSRDAEIDANPGSCP
jgi:hypothetical protein